MRKHIGFVLKIAFPIHPSIHPWAFSSFHPFIPFIAQTEGNERLTYFWCVKRERYRYNEEADDD
jgi:hypothetical protein